MNRILEFFDNCWYYLKRCIPRYKGCPFYKKQFWKLLKDRTTKGYDESVTWSLYYYTAKWIYPRLLLFYDKIEEVGAIPSSYHEELTQKYILNGYSYNNQWHRLDDKEAEHAMHKEAIELWKADVWRMCEAFRDILAEDDHWEDWHKGWESYVNRAQKHYNTLRTNALRKKFWESFGFKRAWYPGIQFGVYDFSEQKRDSGLKLFVEHYMELWN